MSDSELSDAPDIGIPPDFELENSLRREVNRANQKGEVVTVRLIRTNSEQRLGLPDSFYKTHDIWKDRSKDVIHDQMISEKAVPSSPVLHSKTKAASHEQSDSPRPAKRKSAETQSPPPKKQKTKTEKSANLSSIPSDINSDAESEPEARPKQGKRASKPAKAASSQSKQKKFTKAADSSEEPAREDDNSESEMSIVLDEDPKPSKRGKSRDAPSKDKKSKASKPKATAEVDSDQAEIKRLQMWLGRCGIRKVWGAYLKPYETPKAKIKHLKDMLADVGMTGRYSQEKARDIKEARELAADIEAVKEGDERWGTGGKPSDSEDDGQSRGRLVRGSRAQYDFLSSDGEETS